MDKRGSTMNGETNSLLITVISKKLVTAHLFIITFSAGNEMK